MGEHLEGLIGLLASRPVQRPVNPLGTQVNALLRLGVLPKELAQSILDFKEVMHNPAKRPWNDPLLPSRVDRRRFSTHDTLLCPLIMRQLSIRLFEVFDANGVHLPQS